VRPDDGRRLSARIFSSRLTEYRRSLGLANCHAQLVAIFRVQPPRSGKVGARCRGSTVSFADTRARPFACSRRHRARPCQTVRRRIAKPLHPSQEWCKRVRRTRTGGLEKILGNTSQDFQLNRGFPSFPREPLLELSVRRDPRRKLADDSAIRKRSRSDLPQKAGPRFGEQVSGDTTRRAPTD
jgi:hypothetical protein